MKCAFIQWKRSMSTAINDCYLILAGAPYFKMSSKENKLQPVLPWKNIYISHLIIIDIICWSEERTRKTALALVLWLYDYIIYDIIKASQWNFNPEGKTNQHFTAAPQRFLLQLQVSSFNQPATEQTNNIQPTSSDLCFYLFIYF